MENVNLTNSAICIAGAHRSGTSMVTQLLHLAGLYLGPESEWMPARRDNPDGFWENLRFVALNDDVLNQLGGAWDVPPPRDTDFNDVRLEGVRTKALLHLEKFNDQRVWGWKDPRNCLTLPFWRRLLPRLRVLLVVRNPLEVAYSMGKRNGTSYSFGLRLWEIYNRRLLDAAQPGQLFVTHYDAFFENPESELRRVVEFIGLPSSLVAKAASAVSGQKRHTTFSLEQLIDAGGAAEIVELYQSLSVRAREPSADFAIVATEPEEILPGAVNRLNVSIPEAEDVRRELAWLRGAEMQHREELARRDGRITALQENVTRQEDARTRLELQLAALREQLTQAQRELSRLGEQLTQAQRELSRLVSLLNETEKAAARLRSSRRWKMANPFAALREAFGGRKLAGYGHLEKVVSDYSKWRSAHPQSSNVATRKPVAGQQPSVAMTEPPLPTKPIEFPAHDSVEVSIIIPVYNQVRYTQACLAAIQQHQEERPFEVIVVDDYSADATLDSLQNIHGLVYLRNEKNVGFVASCNYGASRARGKYLVFLNNDTLVTRGWLSALRETFEFEPEAGLVGSKLIYPDGRLQEAGGIIWRDGSGWNRGKFDDANKPEYNYLREVDYCSAACVMVPKSLFVKVGGFDTRYVPAYYEDTDLAFKLRAVGFKIFYQPLSQIIHFEGATGGTDLATGAKKYQEVNRTTFLNKWAELLARKPANGDTAALDRLGPGRKRILVIDHHLPMPDRDSGSMRMFQILHILHRLGHAVTFIPDNLGDIPPYANELRKRGIQVILRPYLSSITDYLRLHGPKFDVAILSRWATAKKHLVNLLVYAPHSFIVFDTVDLHFLRTSRQAELADDLHGRLLADETRREEYDLIDQADQTWVVSKFERQLLSDEFPHRSIEVVSNIVEIREPVASFSERAGFLFIGSFLHPPNIDAVLYFVNQIYPLVAQRLPEANFFVIGNNPPPEILTLADDNITITGGVPDVHLFFDQVRLSIAPLRFGAGVKGKINQSMGLGVPVVATSVAIEGMFLTNGEDVLVADDPDEFATQLVHLYQSGETWTRLSTNGLEKTRACYSTEVARNQLSRLLSDERLQRRRAARTEKSAPIQHERSLVC